MVYRKQRRIGGGVYRKQRRIGGGESIGNSVENSPGSHKPVEIGDLRFMTIQELGGFPEVQPDTEKAADGPLRGRERGL